jgi:magnesium transporter
MLKTFCIDNETVQSCPEANATIYVHVPPDAAETARLVNECRIDEHTLQSAQDADELARLEFEPDHVAVIYKRPLHGLPEEKLQFKVGSGGLFLFKDKLIVILSEDIPLFDVKTFHHVHNLIEVFLKLIFRSTLHFNQRLKVINAVSESLEHKINTSMENSHLLNLFALEKSLVYFLNAISLNSTLLERIKMNSAKIGIIGEDSEHLDDIIIENNQCYKLAEIYSNILAGMMDARVSIVSNNLNSLMKTLNVITIGIMVPTLVVSAFSMNVKIPLQGFPWAFWVIMGLAAASTLGFMVFWKRRRR